MDPAQLDHPGLDGGGHLMGTGPGLGAPVGQSGHPTVGIATQPRMHRLAGHPVAAGHVGHAHPVEDVEHSPITLFDHFELHQHGCASFGSVDICINSEEGGDRYVMDLVRHGCKAGTGASVAQVPEPDQGSVKQVPEPRCKA
jgi:hypothetical protein